MQGTISLGYILSRSVHIFEGLRFFKEFITFKILSLVRLPTEKSITSLVFLLLPMNLDQGFYPNKKIIIFKS